MNTLAWMLISLPPRAAQYKLRRATGRNVYDSLGDLRYAARGKAYSPSMPRPNGQCTGLPEGRGAIVSALPSRPFSSVTGGTRSVVACTLYLRDVLTGLRSITLERIPLGCA